MKKMLIVLIATFVLTTSCTDPRGTEAFLTSQGYTQIHTGGYDYFLANKGDFTVTHFKAVNGFGNLVEGAVSHNYGLFGLGARWSIKLAGEY